MLVHRLMAIITYLEPGDHYYVVFIILHMYAFSSADRLLFVINTIKEEIVNRVQDNSNDKGTNMAEKLDKLIEETLGRKLSYVCFGT